MITANTKIRVRYEETDAMGIVHHSKYIIWLEMARIELMDTIGLPYKKLEEQGAFMPVLEVYCKYKRPAFFDDRLTIETSIKEKPFVRLEAHYKVFRDDTLLAIGHTQHTFIDKDGKVIRPPQIFQDHVNRFFKAEN